VTVYESTSALLGLGTSARHGRKFTSNGRRIQKSRLSGTLPFQAQTTQSRQIRCPQFHCGGRRCSDAPAGDNCGRCRAGGPPPFGWVCLACDAVGGHILHVTHDYLSDALGLRRPGITEALIRFEHEGLIYKTRALLHVRNANVSSKRRVAVTASLQASTRQLNFQRTLEELAEAQGELGRHAPPSCECGRVPL